GRHRASRLLIRSTASRIDCSPSRVATDARKVRSTRSTSSSDEAATMDHGRRDLLKLAALTTVVGCAHVPLRPSQASPRDRKTTMPFQPLLTLRLTTPTTQDIGPVPYAQRATCPT